MLELLLSMLLADNAVVLELDLNEDRAMYVGDYTPTTDLFPYITPHKHSDTVCPRARVGRGVVMMFVGHPDKNHCNYQRITQLDLHKLHNEYCRLAVVQTRLDLQASQCGGAKP